MQDVKDQEGAGGFYEEDRARELMYKILNAILHIHSSGVIHRDLKPENIMVDEIGNPVIIDFGLSKDIVDMDFNLRSYVGSKHFMAPEILEQQVHSFPVDIWSLGIILYMMLSGNYPF